MAASDRPPVVSLALADIEAGMALSTEAGWNQTGDDWRHFIENGSTIGLRGEGRLVATAAALPYQGPFGFIGMVLVTQEFRRRGFATHLVDRCIGELRGRGLTPVLDATAAGAEVYRRQGFRPQFVFDRWEGSCDATMPELRQAGSADLAPVGALDTDAFGASRATLLRDFLGRQGTQVEVLEASRGFAMVRQGRRALQAGPIVAASEPLALDLLKRLLSRSKGMIFVDVLSAWRGIAEWLSHAGFAIQRSFTRMALGRSEPYGDPQKLFAVAGPEFG